MVKLSKKSKKSKKSKGGELTWQKDHFQCFSCDDKYIYIGDYQVCEHDSLKVAICDACYVNHKEPNGEWHGSEEWKKVDEDGHAQFCEISGDGGNLIACDGCSCSYSDECLKRWLGQEAFEKLENEDEKFICFICAAEKGETEEKFPIHAKYIKATQRYLKYNERMRLEDEIAEQMDKLKKSKKAVKQFNCVACLDKDIDMSKEHMPKMHQEFNVPICQECWDLQGGEKYFEGKEFTKTDGKFDHCALSGEGGEVISCDNEKCCKSFSTKVLKYWLGEQEFEKLEADEEAKFECWGCNESVGKYKLFQKMGKSIMEAFNYDLSDDEFDGDRILEKEKKKANLKRAAKTVSNGSRKTSRRGKSQPEAEESSDEELEPREKSARKAQEQKSYADESGEESTASDYAPPKVEEKITEQDCREYFKKKIEFSNKKYKDSKIYKALMKNF